MVGRSEDGPAPEEAVAGPDVTSPVDMPGVGGSPAPILPYHLIISPPLLAGLLDQLGYAQPHRIRMSSDSAPSGADAVFDTLTALTGACTREYQTAIAQAATIVGSTRTAANLIHVSGLGRATAAGATVRRAGAIANS